MIRALYSAATGMYAQEMNIDNISNNLANVNTTGFKKTQIQFEDLMYQTIKEAGSSTTKDTNRPVELSVGVGVKPVATVKSFKQGDLINTGNPLDMAISGDGFFKVTKADGSVFYSRDGNFKMNENGQITNSEGYFLDPQITIPSDTESIAITKDGMVMAKVYGQVESEQVGQIELARFINPAGLKSLGSNLYSQTESSGEPMVGNPGDGNLGTIEQGYSENSNVLLVDEMVNMITAQRAYEVNSKVVRTVDSMIQTANGLKR